jgi:NADH-quinone oxidoreductase subunit K
MIYLPRPLLTKEGGAGGYEKKMVITIQHYLVVGVVLFVVGAIGAIARRNILVIFMSIEMMLGASLLTLLALARSNLLPEGKALALLVIAVVVAEAAVGLALVVAMYRRLATTSADSLKLLKG